MSLVEVGLRGEDDVLARHGEATEGFTDVLLVRAVRVGVRRVDEVHAEFEGAGDDRLGLVHADHPLVEAGKTFPKLIPPSQSLWIEMPVVPSVVRSMIGPLRAFDSSSAVGRRSSVESPLRAGPAPLPRLGARTPRRAGRPDPLPQASQTPLGLWKPIAHHLLDQHLRSASPALRPRSLAPCVVRFIFFPRITRHV